MTFLSLFIWDKFSGLKAFYFAVMSQISVNINQDRLESLALGHDILYGLRVSEGLFVCGIHDQLSQCWCVPFLNVNVKKSSLTI